MLGKVNYLWYLYLAGVVSGGLHVHSHILVANLGSEFRIVDLGILAAVAPRLKVLETLSHLGLVIELAVVFFALILSSFLPAIEIKTIPKHEKELHHRRIVVLIHHGWAFSQVNCEKFITIQHVFTGFSHPCDIDWHIFEVTAGVICFYFGFIALIVASRGYHVRELVQIVEHWMGARTSWKFVSEKHLDILLKRSHGTKGTSFSLLSSQEKVSSWIKSIINGGRIVSKSILLWSAPSSLHGFHRQSFALYMLYLHM